ncbi:MAG: S8 family peptidase [Armatimonadota bacterium]|nr:S8 family peptidase [Armatimonadota bacterium]MDR5702970.1 S8 family peptidase [Armatimonadota bacterium]
MKYNFYRGVLAILMIFAAAALAAGAPSIPSPHLSGEHVPDELLVKFAPSVSPDPVARAVGARIVDRIPALGVFVLKVPTGTLEATLLALSRNPLVEYAEVNGIALALGITPNDPYADGVNCYNSSHDGCVSQWAWGKIQAYDAWGITTGSAEVKIAVIDTGIDSAHPDLPLLAPGANFVTKGAPPEDDNGHGTHVAGTIGALTNNATGVAGLNWSISLVPVKVLDASGSGTYSAVANGITWSADNGAKVINLSLGGSVPSKTLEAAVKYAWNKGAVLACAAGNSGTTQKLYPAAYTNCIAVAATDENDQKASFSNYGKWVDVAAPGVHILSTMPNSPVYLTTQYGYLQDYDSLSGTSMATPHVAGLAGLVWARGVCSTNTCVRSRIETTADPIAGTGTYWTRGRINAYKAVQ